MHLSQRARTPIAVVAMLLTTAVTAVAADLVITGTPGNDIISGSPAGESIYGRAGDDTVNGAGGDDELDGGPGADRLSGGEGSDSVAYAGAGVDVSIDGLANDGVTGEGDNVGLDVEDLYGTEAADKLTGSPGPNTIDGAGGADRIFGGTGQDVIFGGDGDDVLEVRDSEVDRIECGAGNDTAIVDEEDLVADDCENVSRKQSTEAPGLTIQVAKRKIILSSVRSKAAVRFVCVDCGKSGKTIYSTDSVKLAKGQIVKFKLPSQIRRKTIEIGIRDPGASPICVRYKIARTYRYTEQRRQACTSVAKDL